MHHAPKHDWNRLSYAFEPLETGFGQEPSSAFRSPAVCNEGNENQNIIQSGVGNTLVVKWMPPKSDPALMQRIDWYLGLILTLLTLFIGFCTILLLALILYSSRFV